MKNKDELVLIENNGVIGKYLCAHDKKVIEAIGTIAVQRENKVAKYRGTVIWSQDISLIMQVKFMKKICYKYCNIDISDKEILDKAREKISWTFGEFFGVDAANIIESSKKYNLNIEMIDINTGKKLII